LASGELSTLYELNGAGFSWDKLIEQAGELARHVRAGKYFGRRLGESTVGACDLTNQIAEGLPDLKGVARRRKSITNATRA
jgi:hypothetical protein